MSELDKNRLLGEENIGQNMKKVIFIVLGLLIFIIATIFAVGFMLPIKHSATVSSNIPASVETVWQKVTNFSAYKTWRKNLSEVEKVSANEWIETDSNGNKIPYKMTVLEDKKKLMVEITGKDLPFGGHWLIELNGARNSTEVTITENGEVYNALFRFMSKFVFGHDATIKDYLRNLDAK